jgi:uncharacterized protein (DUF2062 family)
LPRREDFERNRWIAPIAHRVLCPELWRFTRRSVPRGVALGLFAGFIVPLGQIFLAAFLAMPVRANVSVAVLVTFITNPFTLPFWIVVANRIGRFMLRVDPIGLASAMGSGWGWWDTLVWFAQSAAFTTIGFVVLSIVTSVLGYVVSGFVWRGWIGRKHRARRERHARARAAREALAREATA